MKTKSGSATPLAGARYALGLLLAINLFNYIDRYVLSASMKWMRTAFLLTGIMFVVSGVTWLFGMRHLQRDTEKAPKRL